jgi:hypothetical protein
MFRPLQDLRCQSQGPVAGSKTPARVYRRTPSPLPINDPLQTATICIPKGNKKKGGGGGVTLIFRLGKGLKEKRGKKKKKRVLKSCKGGGWGGVGGGGVVASGQA